MRRGARGSEEGVVSESRFGVTEVDELPEDLRERIGVIAAKSGFVPNIFRALGHRPAELRAFLDYHDALMERTEGLTKAERELVVVATSGANHCTYCIVAHGANLLRPLPTACHHVAGRLVRVPLVPVRHGPGAVRS